MFPLEIGDLYSPSAQPTHYPSRCRAEHSKIQLGILRKAEKFEGLIRLLDHCPPITLCHVSGGVRGARGLLWHSAQVPGL